MRVIHVEKHFDPESSYQINEFLEYKYENIENILITTDDMSPFHKENKFDKDEEYSKKYNVKIIRMKKLVKISNRIIIPGLFSKIDSLKPDIVFFHGIGDFFDLGILTRNIKYKVVRDSHMSWVASRNKLRIFFYPFMRNIFSPFINNSNKYYRIYSLGVEETEYLKHIGISDAKIADLKHGFKPEKFYFSPEARKEIRREYNIADDQILISYVGKMNIYKRPDLVIDIVNGCKNVDKIVLLFVGSVDDRYMSYFEKAINELDKKVKVINIGNQKSDILYKYYSATDICIWPKQTTLSSIHAQACGSTIIMEDEKSNMDRVVESKYLFKKDDLADASIKLDLAINSKDYLLKEKIFSAKKLQELNLNNSIKRLYESWEKLLSEKINNS